MTTDRRVEALQTIQNPATLGNMTTLKRTALLTFLLLLLAAFPFGPLFPLSPWKPGYERLSMARADVYYPSGTMPKDAYHQVDAFVEGAERVLHLSASKHLTVVLTKDWGHFQRLMPHMRSHAVGAVTLATGTIIYITPKLEERGFDHGEFLRHEINHAVLHQNQGVLDAYRMNEVPWLLEGLAVSFGDQKAYLSKDEFLKRAKEHPDLLKVIDPALRLAALDMRFAYPVWRYFVEFLMERDRDRFQKSLLACLKSPREWRDAFVLSFGEPLDAAVRKFEETLAGASTAKNTI
jgi:hypothetical protein